MQTKIIDKQAVTAKFEVTVPADEVEKTYDTVLRSLARQVKIPGFRPGKAPKGVLIQRVGQDALDQEVRDYLVESHYPKAVKELELTPVHAHFHAHEAKLGEDYTFEVMVDLYPEFQLPDVNDIIIDTDVTPITEDMVQEAIEQLQRDYATLVPVERPVEASDYLMIETVPQEAGAEGSRMPIDLERVGEDLQEQLIGKQVGDEVELQFAAESEEEAEASEEDASVPQANPNTLKVVIKDIKAKEKPAADDELAKTLGLETWQEVEDKIRENLKTQQDADTFEAQREEFIDKLMTETDLDLPPSLVNRRKSNLLENLAEDLKKRNLTLEGYIKQLEEKGTREDFDKELQEAAETGVKRDLVLEQLLEQRGTSVSEQEFQSAVRYLAMQEGKDVNRFKKDQGDAWLENYRFLLARDKAVREVVRSLVSANAEPQESSATTAAEAEPDAETTESGDAEKTA